MSPEKLEKLQKEFISINKTIESFSIELTRQVQQLVIDNEIGLGFPIQCRTKTWESIAEKLNFMDVKSVLDLQDLCGLRIVLLFKRDIKKIISIIKQNFKIVREYDTQERLDSDQFGYSSYHTIINMPDKWFEIPTLKNFKGIKAEIQIRTLAQHTWAAASHILQYKTDENVPKTILRSIYRVSAILETVDIEFERFLQERDEYIKQLHKLSPEEINEAKLNVNSLEKILDENFPLLNKSANENYSLVLDDLSLAKVHYPNDLIQLIKKHKDEVLEIDKKYSKERKVDHFFTHVGLLRNCYELEFPVEWEQLKEQWNKKR